MSTAIPLTGRLITVLRSPSRTRPVLTGLGALLIVLALGGAWLVNGYSTRAWAHESAGIADDLREAQTSLLGARVSLYERNFRLAGRRLEDARVLLRRAQARGRSRGDRAGVTAHDHTQFESDIDEAQRLLARLVLEDPERLSGHN
jgi:hypothetical protein